MQLNKNGNDTSKQFTVIQYTHKMVYNSYMLCTAPALTLFRVPFIHLFQFKDFQSHQMVRDISLESIIALGLCWKKVIRKMD